MPSRRRMPWMPMPETQVATGHVDKFCADRLPPRELWPVRDWSGIPELAYPERLNAAVEPLGRAVESGHGDRPVFRHPDGVWTYGDLLEKANRIAHVLVDDLGVVPGNRVLLRGPNNPMLAACWFGVLKAGGVVGWTMPLLREREIRYLADKAEITLALSDARIAAACEDGFRTRKDGSERNDARVIHFTNGVTESAAAGSLEALMCDKPAT